MHIRPAPNHLPVSLSDVSDQIADLARQVQDSNIRASQAIRAANSAVAMRRSAASVVHFDKETYFTELHVNNVSVQSKRALNETSVIRTSDTLSSAMAAQIHALLDAAVENILASNEAASAFAQSYAQEVLGDPGMLLSGTDFAALLGVSEESVRQRHQSGKLIAILNEGRERGRGYPIFQSWDGIVGEPLVQVLKALRYKGPVQSSGANAADAFQFFTGRNQLLGDLTPVQVLTGVGVAAHDQEMSEFLGRPHPDRLEFVKRIAQSMSAQVRGT